MSIGRFMAAIPARSARTVRSPAGVVMLVLLLVMGSGWSALHAGTAHVSPASHESHESDPPRESSQDCLTCHLARSIVAVDVVEPTVLVGEAPLVARLALPHVRPPAPADDLPFLVRGPPRCA